jgi:hypothetical protein
VRWFAHSKERLCFGDLGVVRPGKRPAIANIMYGKNVTIHSNYQSISGIVVVFFPSAILSPHSP